VEDPAQLSVFGPGEHLAAARRALRLTHEDVANQLNLTPSTVLALERDDYAQLPGPTFARGYVRGYARLLGLNEEEILNLCHSNDDQAEADSVSNARSRFKAGRLQHPRRWVLSSLLGIVVLGYTAWWVYDNKREAVFQPLAGILEGKPTDEVVDQDEQSATGVDSAKSTLGEAASEDSSLQRDVGSLIQSELTNLAPGTDIGSSELDSVGESTATSAESLPDYDADRVIDLSVVSESTSLNELEQVIPSIGIESVTVADELPEVEDFSTTQSAALQSSNAEGTQEIRDQSAAGGDNRGDLVIRTSGPSWVEVFDSENHQLVFNMLVEGDVRRVGGRPPYKVVLGNAPVVALEYKGQPVDLTEATRPSNTAQLTVGRAAE